MVDTSTAQVIGRVDDFEPGTRRTVRVAGRAITIFRVDDEFYGIRNSCPHQGGPLDRGRVIRPVESDQPGQMRMCTERAARVACPWHGWEYDLATGESFEGPQAPGVRAYGVEVTSSDGLPDSPPEPGEPLVAETYDVTVEERWVVLHL